MQTKIKALLIGESGVGKTRFAATFPKSYWIMTEPGGYETVEMVPELRANTVKHQYFLPSPIYDTAQVFQDIETAVKEAHELAKTGEVETLILDNLTYLSINKWLDIEKNHKVYSQAGEVNKLAMYADLGDFLYEFAYWYLASFPGNVIVTSHSKQEHEQVLQKKLDKSLTNVPDIVGGFRDRVHGLFSLVMFLDKKYDANKKDYIYSAQTNKGNGRLAKNRYGLPPVVEDISYQTLLKVIETAQNKGESK